MHIATASTVTAAPSEKHTSARPSRWAAWVVLTPKRSSTPRSRSRPSILRLVSSKAAVGKMCSARSENTTSTPCASSSSTSLIPTMEAPTTSIRLIPPEARASLSRTASSTLRMAKIRLCGRSPTGGTKARAPLDRRILS